MNERESIETRFGSVVACAWKMWRFLLQWMAGSESSRHATRTSSAGLMAFSALCVPGCRSTPSHPLLFPPPCAPKFPELHLPSPPSFHPSNLYLPPSLAPKDLTHPPPIPLHEASASASLPVAAHGCHDRAQGHSLRGTIDRSVPSLNCHVCVCTRPTGNSVR